MPEPLHLHRYARGTRPGPERQRLYLEDGLGAMGDAEDRLNIALARVGTTISRINEVRGKLGRSNEALDAFARALEIELVEIRGLVGDTRDMLAAAWSAGEADRATHLYERTLTLVEQRG